MKLTGHLDVKEPFANLFTQGMVIHETFKCATQGWVLPSEVIMKNGQWFHCDSGKKLTIGPAEKMSKSKKNVVDPEEIIQQYGADTARWFMLSDSPPERDIEWTATGAEGAWKFSQKLWRCIVRVAQLSADAPKVAPETISDSAQMLRKACHKTLNFIASDIEALRFNRAIAHVHEFVNHLSTTLRSDKQDPGDLYALVESAHVLCHIISPMMPHLAQECWSELGNQTLLATEPWPLTDESLLQEDSISIAVQINGKRRAEITIAKNAEKSEVEELALGLENVTRNLQGLTVRKVIVVPNRIVNIVAN